MPVVSGIARAPRSTQHTRVTHSTPARGDTPGCLAPAGRAAAGISPKGVLARAVIGARRIDAFVNVFADVGVGGTAPETRATVARVSTLHVATSGGGRIAHVGVGSAFVDVNALRCPALHCWTRVLRRFTHTFICIFKEINARRRCRITCIFTRVVALVVGHARESIAQVMCVAGAAVSASKILALRFGVARGGQAALVNVSACHAVALVTGQACAREGAMCIGTHRVDMTVVCVGQALVNVGACNPIAVEATVARARKRTVRIITRGVHITRMQRGGTFVDI